MGKFIDHTGSRFGRLLVIDRGTNKGNHTRWNCVCDCGNQCLPHSMSLQSGQTQSCGCLALERIKAANTSHGHTIGHSLSPEFRSWTQMVRRCTEPSFVSYPRYGGRGITVCDRWLIFVNFLEDVGLRPGNGYTIDRIDNDGHYQPGNVKWSSVAEQNRNRRSNRWITFNGERLIASEWAKRLGLGPDLIQSRMRRGATDPVVLLAPPKKSA